jgi:hypothetical protein
VASSKTQPTHMCHIRRWCRRETFQELSQIVNMWITPEKARSVRPIAWPDKMTAVAFSKRQRGKCTG